MNLIERELQKQKKVKLLPTIFIPAEVGSVKKMDVDATYTIYQIIQKSVFPGHRPRLLRNQREQAYGIVFFVNDVNLIHECDELQGFVTNSIKLEKKLKAGMEVLILPTMDLQLTQFSQTPGRQFIISEDPYLFHK